VRIYTYVDTQTLDMLFSHTDTNERTRHYYYLMTRKLDPARAVSNLTVSVSDGGAMW